MAHSSEYQGKSQKKNNLHRPMFGKTLLHIGQNPSRERCMRGRLVCFKYNWLVWEGSTTPRKLCIFWFHLGLEAVFPAVKVTHNSYIYIWTFCFLENCLFCHKLDPRLTPTNILCLKNYPSNSTKHEIKETSNFPTF